MLKIILSKMNLEDPYFRFSFFLFLIWLVFLLPPQFPKFEIWESFLHPFSSLLLYLISHKSCQIKYATVVKPFSYYIPGKVSQHLSDETLQ